jgi:hypothetical protein
MVKLQGSQKHPPGAKARFFQLLAARLKLCPGYKTGVFPEPVKLCPGYKAPLQTWHLFVLDQRHGQ